MSLVGKITSFFADKEMTTPVFPRTKIKAVSDDNGIGLNVLLDNINSVPESSTTDNGKFLRVVNGVAAWDEITNAEEVSV